MKTRTKILFAVLLAVLYFAICQLNGYLYFRYHVVPSVAKADLPKNLDEWYEGYNSEFFDDRLPKDTVIDWAEYDIDRMGSTSVLPDGRFHIALNQKYCSADRTAHLVLLHEECHVATFSEITRDPKTEHGPRWRTCMLNLYQQGAFKQELIDGAR